MAAVLAPVGWCKAAPDRPSDPWVWVAELYTQVVTEDSFRIQKLSTHTFSTREEAFSFVLRKKDKQRDVVSHAKVYQDSPLGTQTREPWISGWVLDDEWNIVWGDWHQR